MMLVQAAGVFIQAIAKQFHSDALFVILSCLGKFIVGAAFNWTSIAVMASSYYHNYTSFLTAIALGIQAADFVGPFWAAMIYPKIGYFWVFFLQASIMLLNALSLQVFREKEKAHPYVRIEKSERLGYRQLCKVSVSESESRECALVCFR